MSKFDLVDQYITHKGWNSLEIINLVDTTGFITLILRPDTYSTTRIEVHAETFVKALEKLNQRLALRELTQMSQEFGGYDD